MKKPAKKTWWTSALGTIKEWKLKYLEYLIPDVSLTGLPIFALKKKYFFCGIDYFRVLNTWPRGRVKLSDINTLVDS